MRTTISLDEGLYADLKRVADATQRTVSEVLADAARLLLTRGTSPDAPPPFRPPTRGGGLQPGVQPDDLTRLGAEEDEAQFERQRARDAAP